MRRAVAARWVVGIGVALGGSVVGAVAGPAAAAGELYATVERTASPGERALVRVRATTPGAVTALAFRVEDPATLLDAGLDLRDGASLRPRLLAALDAARPPAPGPARNGAPAAPAAQVAAHLTFVAQGKATLGAPMGLPPAEGTVALPEATVEVPLPASGLYVVEVAHDGETALVAALVSRIALVTKREPGGLLAFAVDRASGHALEGVKVVVRGGGAALAQGTTDARGLWRHAGALPPTAEVFASRGDDLATGREAYFPADVPDRRVYAFTHQPAYRPGERVELKGIVRAWRDGAYALDAGVAEVTVRVVAARATELGQVKAAVSADLGTFVASFDLPASAPVGDASLVVEAGGKAYAAPFRIEEYRKPTFEVTAAPDPARVVSGGDVGWRVEGAYFEGGPLAGAPFSWTLTYHRVDRDLFPTDELAHLFFGREREAFTPTPVAQGEGVLDAQGVARIATKAPVVPDDGFLTLRVTATAPDRTVAAGSGTAALSAAPLRVALRTDKHLYGAEGVARVIVRAVRADGSPAAKRAGVVTASQVEEAGPERLREEVLAGTWPVETGEDGSVALDVPFARNGRWALSVAVPRVEGEPAGPAATATTHVWVVGDRADVGFSGDRIEVVTDKDTYAVGDRARILVLAPVGARPFLSTVEGARIFAADAVRLGGADDRGAAAVLEVTIGPEHVPNAYVGVALVDQGNLLASEKLLRVPPVDRLLTPTVVPAKTEAEPGETVAMTAKVVDATSGPVEGAEVSVAVVDEALYALYADPAAPIAPFFHPVRRNDVRTGGPLHLASVGFHVSNPPGSKAAEGRELADGGTGAPAPGAPPPPALAPAAPAPESAPADAEGETLGAAGRPSGGAAAPARGRRLAERARDDDAPAKKAKSDASGEGPLEARADFRSAVHWSPTLRTGADGTVAVGPVRLGDSLTRWRVTAVAVDARTRVGTSTTTVRTAKKVLTRVTLPRFLRSTDVVKAPWVLHSLLREDTRADALVSATGLELRGPSRTEEVLGAGAVVTHDLTLVAGAPGAAKVRAELRTPAGSDAVEHALPVLPQGVPKTLVASASAERGRFELPPLTMPRSADRSTARLRIVVTPSVAQAVGAALPYLADYPYGCTEQTMSRLVPVVVAKAAQDRFHVPLRGRLEALPKMLDAGLARLRVLQHDDGGFSWWEKDGSDAWMTAYVVHGLSRATQVMAEPAPATAVLDRAATWLATWLDATAQAGEPGRDVADAALRRAFATMALADAGRAREVVLPPDDGIVVTAPLVRALLLRAAVAAGVERDGWAGQVAALTARATRDAAGVRWAPEGDRAGRFGGDAVETTAWVAGALLAADPRHADLAGAVRWLLGQRVDGERWHSTRDTAACVAFLTRYATATGDLGAGRRVELSMNGLRLRPVAVTPETAFSDAAVVTLEGDALPKADVLVAAEADAPVTVTAVLSFHDTGPAVAPASAGFTVQRTWWRITTDTADGKPVLRRTAVTESVPSGSLLDVEVTVTTDRARELVMIESPHAASFEPEKDTGTPVEGAGPAARADHRETRDDRTVFFVTSLPAGTHVFRHRVRAVHAGSFTALPARAALMYADEVAGNGAGEVLEVSVGGAAATEQGGGK